MHKITILAIDDGRMTHQYPNSPLTEVICEFRFASDIKWDHSIAEAIYTRLRQQFPRRIEGNDRYVSEGSDVDETLQFWHDDDNGVVILSPDTLSVTHFRPYPGWERFRSIVMDVFNAQMAAASPRRFRRIGLRYTNDITFPAGDEPISIYDYIRFGVVATVEGLPNTFTELAVKMDIPFQELRDNLSIGVVCTPNQRQERHMQIDLDYQLRQPQSVSLQEARHWLDQAHDVINTVFEGTIRDTLRDQFNEEDD